MQNYGNGGWSSVAREVDFMRAIDVYTVVWTQNGKRGGLGGKGQSKGEK